MRSPDIAFYNFRFPLIIDLEIQSAADALYYLILDWDFLRAHLETAIREFQHLRNVEPIFYIDNNHFDRPLIITPYTSTWRLVGQVIAEINRLDPNYFTRLTPPSSPISSSSPPPLSPICFASPPVEEEEL